MLGDYELGAILIPFVRRARCFQQRIDGGHASRRICPGPLVRAEASPHLSFGVLPEVVYRFVDNRCTSAFGDSVPSAQNPGRPGVIALEYCRRGEKINRSRAALTFPAASSTCPNTYEACASICKSRAS
jgi:hypothetical protein